MGFSAIIVKRPRPGIQQLGWQYAVTMQRYDEVQLKKKWRKRFNNTNGLSLLTVAHQ